MPRVGNVAFANWTQSLFPTQHIRIVNQNDMTPHLPPVFVGFQHSGNETWIADDSGDTLDCRVTSGESAECGNAIKFGWDVSKHGYAWDQKIGHRSCYSEKEDPILIVQ